EEDVIDRITTMPRGFNQDTKIFLHLLLADVVIQCARTQTRFEECFIHRLSRPLYYTLYHTTIPFSCPTARSTPVLSAPGLVRRLSAAPPRSDCHPAWRVPHARLFPLP